MTYPFWSAALSAIALATIASAETRVVDPAYLDQLPERLEFRPVEITDALKSAGDHTVTMTAIVSTDGKVERIENVKAATPAAATAATEAVKKWLFNRAFSDGKPVSYALPISIPIRPGQLSDVIADAGDATGLVERHA